MPQSSIIADAAPCSLGISLLELIRSYLRILGQPLHDIMSVDGTTEMKACFVAEKICLQRVLLFSCLLKALTVFQMFVSIIAEQFMHIVWSVWVVFLLFEYPLDRTTTGTPFLCNFFLWNMRTSSHIRFVHHKPHMLPRHEPGPPRWEASD
jgi:hypothetical protein